MSDTIQIFHKINQCSTINYITKTANFISFSIFPKQNVGAIFPCFVPPQ